MSFSFGILFSVMWKPESGFGLPKLNYGCVVFKVSEICSLEWLLQADSDKCLFHFFKQIVGSKSQDGG